MTLRNEAALSAAVAKWAKGRGYLETKLDAGRGWPDRLFILPNGRVAFIEFKNPTLSGKAIEPRPLQQYVIDLLKTHRANVLVTNDITQAKDFLIALELKPD